MKIGDKVRIVGSFQIGREGTIKERVLGKERKCGVQGDWWVEFGAGDEGCFFGRELELLEKVTLPKPEQVELF